MKRSLTQPLVLFSLVLSGFLIADDRPNIIFFLTDDQRHDTLGCAGNPIVETPTIDKLAAQGARFTNMFVTRSTCWASRTTILTGLTSRSSVKGDGSDQIKPEALTELFPDLLRDAGYHTGFNGKWHAKMPKDFKPEEHFDEYERIFRRPYFKTMPDRSKRHETELIADRGIEFLKSQGKSVSSMPATRTRIPPYEFLHDLENDPDELVNFAKNPEYAAILTELRLRNRSLAEKYANANLETE